MHTEEAARELWCPMAGGAAEWRCMGSACSMWRWGPPLHDTRERHLYSKSQNKRVVGAIGDDADWRPVNPEEPAPVPEGFCGLAGRPL